jgi:hypothetical protein
MNLVKTVALSIVLLSTAAADEVILRNGSLLSGVVREDGDRVILEMDYGTMTFKKMDVKSINRGEDVVSQFQAKALAATDIKTMLELAAWAKDKGLAGRASELYRKVLVLDPDQSEARKSLGYEKVNGLWLSGDDLMVAKGFVKVGGRWMTRDLAGRLLLVEAQAKMESDRMDLARRIAEQRHSEIMTRISLEREGCWWRNGWALAPGPFGGVAGYLMPVVRPVPMPPPVMSVGQPIPLAPTGP